MGYVVEAGRPEAIADAVIQYLKEDKEEEFTQNIKQKVYQFSWERIVEK